MLAWSAFAAAGQAQSLEYPQTPVDNGDFGPRPSFMSRVGNGIGYTGGYNRLETFIPMRQEAGDFLTFGDMRFLMDYGGRLGGSVGLGHRVYSEEFERTFGGYIYGDVREDAFATFSQMSGGLETLGQNWDFRTNFYAPISTRTGSPVNFTPLSGPFLAGNNIYAYGSKRYDQSMGGFDSTLAVRVYSNVRLYGGMYYFSGAGTEDAIGARTGVDVQWRDYINTNLALQSDRVFGTNVLFGLTFSYSGNRRNPHRTDINPRNRLADQVEKQDLIVVSQQNRQANYAYIDPRTGQPIQVLYVDQAAAAGGNGTVEHPFQNLGQAQTALVPFDFLFVGHGNYFTALTLPTDTTLMGDGTAHMISTLEGSILFPKDTPGVQPMIVNVNGPAITLANRDVVSGMGVNGMNGTSAQGIVGSGADNVTLDHNLIMNTGAEGIKLGGPKGTNVITNNTIINSGTYTTGGASADAIEVSSNNSDTQALTIANNTVTGTSGDGVRLNITDTSNTTTMITGNTISGTGKSGIEISGLSSSATASNVTVANNTVDFNGGASATQGAIRFLVGEGMVNGTVTGNTINMADAASNAIILNSQSSATLSGTVSGNMISGTYTNGVELISQDASSINSTTISGNTFTGTYTTGVAVMNNDASSLTATISGNTFTNPGSYGVNATQPGTGTANLTVSGNTFNENTGAAGNAAVLINPTGSVGSTFMAAVSGNTFEFANANLNGLAVTSTNGSNISVTYTNNTATGTYNDGMLITSAGNSVVTATASGNNFAGTFQHGFEVASNDSSLLNTTLNSNTVTGAASDGMLLTANNLSNFTVNATGNNVTAGAAAGVNLIVNDNANAVAGFSNNPNLVTNATGDLNETTNGGFLTTQLINNAGFAAGPHGTINLTNNGGIFNVSNDPVADNPSATVTVGPGVNTNTGTFP